MIIFKTPNVEGAAELHPVQFIFSRSRGNGTATQRLLFECGRVRSSEANRVREERTQEEAATVLPPAGVGGRRVHNLLYDVHLLTQPNMK